MANELTASRGIEYLGVDGFQKLQTQDIGEHVYFTQACRTLRQFMALRGARERHDDPFVRRIYLGCGTDEQRDDVASLVSTIKDTKAGNLVECGCRGAGFHVFSYFRSALTCCVRGQRCPDNVVVGAEQTDQSHCRVFARRPDKVYRRL